jgi:hypothetical protein
VSYAEKTSVSSERSRAEIETTLLRYGADQFMYGWDEGRAVIQFRANERYVRFVLPMPDKDDPEFTRTPSGRRTRDRDSALKAWEQEGRRRWRALALAVKAKLEVVASGIATFEDEFMANIVLPGGETVGEWLAPQIDQAYKQGVMPQGLLALPAAGGTG